MSITPRFVALAVITTACFASCPTAHATDYVWSGEPPTYTEQQLAVGGDGQFPNYRIPALAVSNRGTVLASYDGRPTSWDAPGPNTILQRRSTDGGRTWAAQTAVHEGKSTQPIEGYSDPSYIVDRETGTIFNFHVKSFDVGLIASRPGVDPNDRKVLHAEVSVSKDDGLTWEHQVITADITPDLSVKSRFAASGQGIQLRYGQYRGRLVQQFTIVTAKGDFQAVSIYSDDHGASWKSGKPVGTRMDENKTVELSDGRVMLNSRDSGRSGYRKVAYSIDGGISYGPVTIDRNLPDPANNASIIRAYPEAKRGSHEAKVLLFSNAATHNSRSHGTVRVSCDDGQSWPVAKEFRAGEMAYSTLANLPDGQVGMLYEPGHNGLTFARFSMSWLNGLCAPITPEAELTIPRGEQASSHLVVTHQVGPSIKNATLSAQAPEGWVVNLDQPKDKLLPQRSWRAGVTVQVPATARGGSYEIPLRLTDSIGRQSVGTLRVEVPKTPEELDGRITVTGTHTNPKESYQVGDVLRFDYRVTNVTAASTTVVPTGNLQNLDPTQGGANCRWIGLRGNDAYTCHSANHVVTAEDLAAGSFTANTVWTSTAASGDVSTVTLDAPVVKLS